MKPCLLRWQWRVRQSLFHTALDHKWKPLLPDVQVATDVHRANSLPLQVLLCLVRLTQCQPSNMEHHLHLVCGVAESGASGLVVLRLEPVCLATEIIACQGFKCLFACLLTADTVQNDQHRNLQ